MKPRPTFYILDAFSLIYQVFHAIPLMTSPAGEPTQAVFGIFRDLLNLNRDRKPDYLAAAFDGPGPVFRSDLYAEYKANRAAMPDDLVPQIPVIRRVFEGFRVPVLIQEGMEADDVIATLARRGAERGLDVFICTADKDARQLLSDQIRIYNLRKQSVLDVAALKADWGVGPEQVVDLLALSGDTSDNVPGVPGIGLKTGAKLLEEFGTLENLLANVEQGHRCQAQGEPPRASGDRAAWPASWSCSATTWSSTSTGNRCVRRPKISRPSRRSASSADSIASSTSWPRRRGKSSSSGAMRKRNPTPPWLLRPVRTPAPWQESPATDRWKYDYRLVDTPELFAEFLAELGRQPRFCIDTETTALDPLRAELVGLSFSWQEGQAAYLPLLGPPGSRLLDREATLGALRPILTDPAIEKVGQNIKYDMQVLGHAGIELAGPITDTMVLSYLLESGERNHNLDQLAHRLLDHAMIPITDLIGKGKNQRTMDQVEVAKVAQYAGEDADATWRIEAILAPKVRAEGLWNLYAELERPLIAVLARMETVGVKVDVPRLRQLSVEFAGRA